MAKIAVLVKRFPRLSETFVLNEFLELRRQGLDVHMFALMDPMEKVVHPEAAAIVPEVVYLRDARRRIRSSVGVWLGALRQAAARPRAAARVVGLLISVHRSLISVNRAVEGLWLAGHLQAHGFTHLHAHFAHGPAAVAYFARIAGGPPYSFTAHAKDLYTTMPRNLMLRSLEAKFVVTCTGFNGAYLSRVLKGAPHAPVHVIHHGSDLSRFSLGSSSRESATILTVGRMVPKKGHAVLATALAIACRSGLQFRWEVFGGGELRTDLEKLVTDLGIAARTRFHGAREQREIQAAYSRATVFALAPVVMKNGDRDGIPNVLVEAMASGLPVVSTRISGIPELIDDGSDGLLVEPGDAAALADAIVRLLSDAGLRMRLASSARRKVEQSFDLRVNTEQLATLFSGAAVTPPVGALTG